VAAVVVVAAEEVAVEVAVADEASVVAITRIRLRR
jgi:hypothetical protein